MVALLVEDEQDIAAFIRKGLAAEGFSVEWAADGRTALDLIEVNDYDVIILDLLLPKVSGLEVLESIRADGVSTPVIVVTAKASVDDRVQGLDQGADDYLVKPFSFEELLARVRALTRRGRATLSPTLKVGDVELNESTHEVRRAGRVLLLTKKEYAILDFMMRNPDRVCTRSMIGEHVWGFEFDMMSNVIDVHVARLRRKLDKGFPKNAIKTVRDVGYRLSS